MSSLLKARLGDNVKAATSLRHLPSKNLTHTQLHHLRPTHSTTHIHKECKSCSHLDSDKHNCAVPALPPMYMPAQRPPFLFAPQTHATAPLVPSASSPGEPSQSVRASCKHDGLVFLRNTLNATYVALLLTHRSRIRD